MANTLLVVAAFGPYLSHSLGIRTEQCLVYGAALLLLPHFLTHCSMRRSVAAFTGIWMFILAIALCASLDGSRAVLGILANLDSMLVPITAVFVSYLTTRHCREEALAHLAGCLCTVLVVHSLWVVAGLFFNTMPISAYFWGPTAAQQLYWAGSAGANAAMVGRVTGIFNQPLESGAMYSIGLFAWVYLVKKRGAIRFRDLLTVLALLIGGIPSVSKTFILGGLPIAVVYLVLPLTRRGIRWTVALVSVLAVLVFAFSTIPWSGQNFFTRLFRAPGDEGLISLWTGRRFGGDGGSIARQFAIVAAQSPWIGLGFGVSIPCPIDNAYFGMYLYGGVLGLFAYLFLLVGLWGDALILHRTLKPEGGLFLALVVCIVGAGLGGPVITLNRVSVVLGLFLGILL